MADATSSTQTGWKRASVFESYGHAPAIGDQAAPLDIVANSSVQLSQENLTAETKRKLSAIRANGPGHGFR